MFGSPRVVRGELGDSTGTPGSGRDRLLAQWPCGVALEQSDYSAAIAFSRGALSIRRTLGDKMGIAELLEKLSAVFSATGNAFLAAHIGGAAERLREEIGFPLTKAERLHHDRHMASARAASRDGVAFNQAWREGRALSLEQAIEISLEARLGPNAPNTKPTR